MPKGQYRHGSNTGAENAIAELYGGIKERVILFSAETGISAAWVAERLSELLSPERTRVLSHLSELQLETAGTHRAVEPLALAVHAHRSEAPPAVEPDASKTATGQAVNSQSEYWAKMTVEERSAEMRRRMRKWTPEAKEKWKGGNEKKKTKGRTTPEKQKVYQARYAARKRGEVLPPLPQAV